MPPWGPLLFCWVALQGLPSGSRVYFPTPWTWDWPHNLHWPIEYRGSNTMRPSGLVLKRPFRFCFHSLGSLPWACKNTDQSPWGLKTIWRERPSLFCYCSQAQGFADMLLMGPPCEDPPSEPTELWELVNGTSFKPLNFRAVCSQQ